VAGLRVHFKSAMQLPPPITSRTNARVKALRAAFSGKASKPGEMIAIEGEHLIGEALRSFVTLETVFVREGSERVLGVAGLAGLQATHWVVLAKDVFASAVATDAPQGIAATLRIPAIKMRKNVDFAGVQLVLEDLQDPGNLGTLIRSAEAFGMHNVFITPRTVNPWNPKVVRASAGSIFRMPVVRSPLEQTKAWMDNGRVRIFAAVVQGETAKLSHEAVLLPPCALLIGNEGAGLSQEAIDMAYECVRIPCQVESLNAAIAGSVLMYEASRSYEDRLPSFIDLRRKPKVVQ